MKRKERRRFPRIPIHLLAKYRPQGSPASEIAIASVSKNISLNGLMLRVKEPLAVGQNLEVEINMPVFNKSIEVKLKVVWIRPLKGTDFFDIGAKFLEISEEDRRDVLDYVNFINKMEQESRWSFKVKEWLSRFRSLFKKEGCSR